MSDIITDQDLIKKMKTLKDSMPDHTITTNTFRENTILHRLKGLLIDDPKRDIDHPKNREE